MQPNLDESDRPEIIVAALSYRMVHSDHTGRPRLPTHKLNPVAELPPFNYPK